MKKLFLVLAFAACASTGALAQDQSPAPQGGPSPEAKAAMRAAFMFERACGADVRNYCASTRSPRDRHACVMANKDNFSPSCKAFMANHPLLYP